MTTDSLSSRVARLEQANRRWKAAGLGVALLAGAISMMGQASSPAKVVRAERFELVDSTGKVRGLLDTGPDGSPEFVLSDAFGGDLVSIRRLTNRAPRLTLSDRRGKGRLCLAVQEDGTPSMWMFDKEGNTRVILSITDKDEVARLAILDKAGTVVGKLPP